MHSRDLKLYRKISNASNKSAYVQALDIFLGAKDLLHKTVRTWVYIKHIDKNYTEVVRARNLVFDEVGLNDETHFIASTGIEGRLDGDCLVQVDFLVADHDTVDNHTEYMEDLKRMPRTSDYGVRFERGAKVEYDDCTHAYISGTASIDAEGNIVHSSTIAQYHHAMANVCSLLIKYGMDLRNVSLLKVYYRNHADYAMLKRVTRDLLEVKLIRASICRPGWLVELECTAVKAK